MTLDAPALSRFLHKHVKPVVSPWCEMLASLHVLDQPEHHSYKTDWARITLASWPADRIEQLRRLSGLTMNWLSPYGIQQAVAPLGLEEGIARLEALPDAEWLWTMLDRRLPLAEILVLMNTSGGLPEDLRQNSRDALPAGSAGLLRDTAGVRREMGTFLRWYQEHVFEQEWRVLEPWLMRETGAFMESFRRDPAAAVNSLHPRLTAKGDAIEAQKADLYRFPYTDIRQIVILPSAFMFPHLLIDFADGCLCLPMHAASGDAKRNTETPADLLATMKALADANRLQILRILRAQPHCTQQLSAKLQISEAAVSKHLALLAQARLVTPERRGAYVFYRLHAEQTEMTIVSLRQFLEQ